MVISTFHFLKIKVSGVNITMFTRSSGAANFANASGLSFAMDFGEISPNISTMTVVTIVAIVAPYDPYRSTNSTVATAVIVMFTMLFPIRIVESTLSNSSARSSTSLARESPSDAAFFSLTRFSDVKAVSVAEKYPEKIRSTTMATMYTAILCSIPVRGLLYPSKALYMALTAVSNSSGATPSMMLISDAPWSIMRKLMPSFASAVMVFAAQPGR